MDLTLLLSSILSLVTTVVVIVLLVVVLRRLGRHRREIAALREITEQEQATGAAALDPAGGPAVGEAPSPGEAPGSRHRAEGQVGPGPGGRLQQVAIVLNPAKFADPEVFRDRVRDVVESIEAADVTFYETTVEDPGMGQARRALTEGADLVVAAGGDGTVRMVASVLAGSGTRMGIIPAGTGNLLARNVDVPLEDPAAAMTAALTGTDRRIDVGWLQTGGSLGEASVAAPQIFLVIAGFGADAEMIGYTDPTMKKRLGWIAYVFGGIRTILGRSVDVVVDLPDGTRHSHKARTVLLGNVGKLPGGFVIMPDAHVDNGRLDIVVAGWRGAAGFSQVLTEVVNPRLAPRRRPGAGPRLSTMERYQATTVRVATTKPQPVQLDGDTDVEATHMIGSLEAGVLRLRVPVSPRPTKE